MDQLTAIANRYGTDKGDRHYNAHHYTLVYHALFAPMRSRPIRLLEIGLLHPRDPHWSNTNDVPRGGGGKASSAPSLAMWSEYFPHAEIHGFDINDFSDVELEDCTIHQGDSGRAEDLRNVASLGPFDIIIDDASHASAHQQTAFGVLFVAVRSGGYYIIEDLNWQPADLEHLDTPKTRAVLRRLKIDRTCGEFYGNKVIAHGYDCAFQVCVAWQCKMGVVRSSSFHSCHTLGPSRFTCGKDAEGAPLALVDGAWRMPHGGHAACYDRRLLSNRSIAHNCCGSTRLYVSLLFFHRSIFECKSADGYPRSGRRCSSDPNL